MIGLGRIRSDNTEGPLVCFSAGQGPFSGTVAGEGFEPSKLSRRIYSPHRTEDLTARH